MPPTAADAIVARTESAVELLSVVVEVACAWGAAVGCCPFSSGVVLVGLGLVGVVVVAVMAGDAIGVVVLVVVWAGSLIAIKMTPTTHSAATRPSATEPKVFGLAEAFSCDPLLIVSRRGEHRRARQPCQPQLPAFTIISDHSDIATALRYRAGRRSSVGRGVSSDVAYPVRSMETFGVAPAAGRGTAGVVPARFLARRRRGVNLARRPARGPDSELDGVNRIRDTQVDIVSVIEHSR